MHAWNHGKSTLLPKGIAVTKSQHIAILLEDLYLGAMQRRLSLDMKKEKRRREARAKARRRFRFAFVLLPNPRVDLNEPLPLLSAETQVEV